MIEHFAAAQRGVEVAFGAQNLFGAEASALVGAAGARERARVDHDTLPCAEKTAFGAKSVVTEVAVSPSSSATGSSHPSPFSYTRAA